MHTHVFYVPCIYSGVDGRNCATKLWINLNEVSCLVYASGLITTTPGSNTATSGAHTTKKAAYHVLRSLSYITDQYMKLYHKENGSTSTSTSTFPTRRSSDLYWRYKCFFQCVCPWKGTEDEGKAEESG